MVPEYIKYFLKPFETNVSSENGDFDKKLNPFLKLDFQKPHFSLELFVSNGIRKYFMYSGTMFKVLNKSYQHFFYVRLSNIKL